MLGGSDVGRSVFLSQTKEKVVLPSSGPDLKKARPWRHGCRVPPDTLEWFRLHFAPSPFHGRIQLGQRGGNRSGILPLFTCNREEMEEFIGGLQVYSSADYYITANMISGVKRRAEELFSLHNLVIDLDCHGMLRSKWELEESVWRILRDLPSEMEHPSSVVYTGRGVQFWWALKPLHVKCKSYYDEVKEHYLVELRHLLEENPSEFEGFQVDEGASQNGVGYFRLPGTFNSKVGELVTVEFSEQPSVYVLQDLVAGVKRRKESLFRERKWEKSQQIQGKKEGITWTNPENQEDFLYGTSELYILKNYYTLGFFRMKQLIQLRLLRCRHVGEEERNNFCFLAYNAMLPGLGPEKSWEKLLWFNQGFQNPMTEKELEVVIYAAKAKGGYKYSNEKVIEFLSITPEEQEKIGLFVYRGMGESYQRISSNPSRKASRQLVKENRNQQIIQLHKKGHNNLKIAEILGISHVTVGKILGETRQKEQEELKMKAIKLREEHKNIRDIALLLGCSYSKIQRCLL